MNWYGNTQTHEWGPTITSALSAAYSEALLRAHDLGLEKDKSGRPASDTIAQYIVAGAKRGVYDSKVLADGALRYLQR
jgi:hypothetical protein